jgi:selenocysteine lyase/cysteine desulfurase
MNIDVLAFSGHKSLYGPMGTGGLYVREGIRVRPLKYGGTGSNSDSDDQPEFSPDIYESGTLNAPGIAGLGAGLDFIRCEGFERIQGHGATLAQRFCDKVSALRGITVIGPRDRKRTLPTVSLTVRDIDHGLVARRLSDDYGVCARMGLHCAPNAHRALGTFPQGTIRFSFGFFNTEEDVDVIVGALKTILTTSA